MKGTLFTAFAIASLTAVAAQAQSADEKPAKPAEKKISDIADKAAFGAQGYTTTDGDKLYKTLCAGCHMPDGGGAEGAAEYPSLRNDAALEFAAYPVSIIVNGRGAMPGLGGLLDDEQVAAVTSYIQSHLDNDYEPSATADMVAKVRPDEAANSESEEPE